MAVNMPIQDLYSLQRPFLLSLFILVSVVDYNSRALQENFLCPRLYTGYAISIEDLMAPAVYSPIFFLVEQEFKPKKKTTHLTLSQTAAETLLPPDNSFAFHSHSESASIFTFSYGGLLGPYTAPSPCFICALAVPEKVGVNNRTPRFCYLPTVFFFRHLRFR
jgi:hypothetical protein